MNCETTFRTPQVAYGTASESLSAVGGYKQLTRDEVISILRQSL